METPSRVFHFIAPYFIAGSDVMAGREFEAVQQYIHSPDILYSHEQVSYTDLWEKTSAPSKPDLLHIVAHGADGQLLTADAYLQHLAVDSDLFAKDVKAHLGSHLKYIYLGVCDSGALARALAAQGFTVLCFEGKVVPQQGVFFAENFYKFFLQEKMDFYAAYTAAKNTWKTNGFHTKGVAPRFYCTESGDAPPFAWNAEQYKVLLDKLRSAKQPRLLEAFFEELNLDTSALEPLNLPNIYRYLKANQALFLLRDRAEAFFLANQHAYTASFMNIEEGLLSAYVELPQPSETKKYTAIAATDLEYKRALGIVGTKTLSKNGLHLLAKELVLPLGLDFERIKTHMLHEVPVLQVRVSPDDAQTPPMDPDKCMAWITRHKKKFFVLEGAAGSGKTTFLADMVWKHFLHYTSQKVFIARFSSVPALNAQLETWEKDAIGNILILDALDELYDESDAILGLLAEKGHPVRAFSKVVLSFRDTFLKANKPLQEAIDQEDWTLLHIAPLEFTDVQDYLRKCFPLDKQEVYGAALNYVKAGDTLPPLIREGVTPFLIHHIQFLLEESDKKEGTPTYWDVMNRLAEKIMEKSSLVNGRKNPALQQKLLSFFMEKVLQAYQQGQTEGRMVFAQYDLENLPIDERLLRNFSFLTKVEDDIAPYYTFSHSHFRDYFLARLLFEGHIREVDFDKGRYPDAYRLYQDSCWKRIAPKGAYLCEWHPVVASALPCFAFQVMMRKHGGELPLRRPSVSAYFRGAFKHWQPKTWQTAKDLAVRQVEGQHIGAELEAVRKRQLLEHTASELAQVVDFAAGTFRHPLYRDVFAFLHKEEQSPEAALAFLDQSPFGWLFRRERHWLEYGAQTDAYSLVYPEKDDDSVFSILTKAIGVDFFTDFDREVCTALQTPAMLERYYGEATRLHIQVHTSTLPAQLLNDIPFPEQFEELSIGGGAALTGDWDLSAFENLEVLDLSGADIAQLRIAKCPPLLETIIHPQADQIPVPEDGAWRIECLTRYLEAPWTQEVPDAPLPPEMVEVEGGIFEMGKGWGEAILAWMAEQQGQELPDISGFGMELPTFQAQLDTFYMAKYPVTVGEYARFVKATGYRTRAERFGFAFGAQVYRVVQGNRTTNMYSDYLLPGLNWRHSVWGDKFLGEDVADLPVVYISHEDAEAYAQWLTNTTGKGGVYRLPTEAEWEYAAKGGKLSEGYLYAGSDHIDEVAHYGGQDERRPVGAAYLNDIGKPNELGLYDMSGNVWEWCRDWFDQEYYAQCKAEEPVKNPAGPETGSLRVVRGGSWNSNAAYCRSAHRNRYDPGDRNSFTGFRLVFVPQ